jgi:hypothetical protein
VIGVEVVVVVVVVVEIEMLHSVTVDRSSGTAPAATFFSMAVVSTCCTPYTAPSFAIAWEMVRNQSGPSLFPANVRSSALGCAYALRH